MIAVHVSLAALTPGDDPMFKTTLLAAAAVAASLASTAASAQYAPPMDMSWAIQSQMRNQAMGDAMARRAYINAYNEQIVIHPDGKNIVVMDKTCLCTHMRNFNCWTCGSMTYRQKDTTRRLADGSYQTLSAEHIFRDYQFSVDQKVALPDEVTEPISAVPPG